MRYLGPEVRSDDDRGIRRSGVYHHYLVHLALQALERAWQIPLAVAVWGLNLALSSWWLARFRFGPLEWMWRAVTYAQWPPLRRGSGI